jgi:hypothetical protein
VLKLTEPLAAVTYWKLLVDDDPLAKMPIHVLVTVPHVA